MYLTLVFKADREHFSAKIGSDVKKQMIGRNWPKSFDFFIQSKTAGKDALALSSIVLHI